MSKRLVISALLLLNSFLSLLSQEEKFKAVLMYNFTKYIEWPAADKQGYFIIGVIGSQEMAKHLSVIAEKMKVGSQPITVRYFSSARDAEKCHMIYLPNHKSDEFEDLKQKFPHCSVFFVTDKSGMISKGACINFYSKNGEVKFEINKENASRTGLKINSTLIMLGKSS